MGGSGTDAAAAILAKDVFGGDVVGGGGDGESDTDPEELHWC